MINVHDVYETLNFETKPFNNHLLFSSFIYTE